MRVTLLVAMLLLPVSALAQDAPDWANKAGAVGIGGNSTLGGTHGLNLRTYVSARFGIMGTLGFNLTSRSASPELGGGDIAVSQTAFSVGLYPSYKLAYWQRGSLAALFGGDVRVQSTAVDGPAGGGSDTSVAVLVGLGIQGEYFPTQYLSLFAHTGLRLDFLTDDDGARLGVDTGSNSVSGIDIGLGGDLWGSAGFTVWFN